MLKAHKMRLDPNNRQATYLARAAGTARFADNWGLEEWGRQYQACLLDPALPKPNEAALRRQLNAVKRGQFPWIRMRERLRLAGRIVSICISRTADQWYASVIVDMLDEQPLPPSENQGAVGLDLGVNNLVTLSTGEIFAGSKAMRHGKRRLRRLSRSLSRKQKGSRNRAKARRKLARQHARMANIRANDLHQLTTSVTRRYHTIGIEDLNVKGMLRNRCLSLAIADMGFGELRRQLEYKTAWRGGEIVVVDRWYPSSKMCSCCGGKIKALSLAQRHWDCPACGARHDRDINAAINLRNMAVSSTVAACGGEGSGPAQAQGETGPGEAGIQL